MPIRQTLESLEPLFDGAEVTEPHTRLLRVSLAAEESRAYWERRRLDIPKPELATLAFEERWFGNKSMDRVKRLLSEFEHRYDRYPTALVVLTKWQPVDPVTRQNLCHWHLQLADPTYRHFTGDYLEQRRYQKIAAVDRDIVTRWVVATIGSDWAPATAQRMATGLLTAAAAAGLCARGSGSRALSYPQISDEALTYWLYFLRQVEFEGTLMENPYLASVGLSEGFLEQRLRKLPDISFNRMAELHDFGWAYPALKTWALARLGGNP